MVTRRRLVAKIEHFSTKIGDENWARRQNWAFFDQNWWRDWGSSPKLSVFRPKMVTRLGFVVKIECFSPQNGDENGVRRQKLAFFSSNWWRDWASSPKLSVFRPKMVTRLGFVAKIEYFSPQNGDEIGFRRQKLAFFSSNWWRDWASSPKLSVFRPKMATRFGFVVKNWLSSPQIGDEIRPRRQKWVFLAPKWRREYVSSSKLGVSCLKTATRRRFVVKNWAFPASKRWREQASSSKNSIPLPKLATRIRFVVKIGRFLPQIGDEIRPRRQKTAFLSSNWRREYVSSSKLGVSCLKTVTRTGLVAKKRGGPCKKDDEIRPRRQKWAFPTLNWRWDKEGEVKSPPSQIRKISKIHFPLFIISVKIKFAWLFSWPHLLRWNG